WKAVSEAMSWASWPENACQIMSPRYNVAGGPTGTVGCRRHRMIHTQHSTEPALLHARRPADRQADGLVLLVPAGRRVGPVDSLLHQAGPDRVHVHVGQLLFDLPPGEH